MAVIISHSHFGHVAFASILIFQTFDRMIFGRLSFPGTRRYVLTVQDPQVVRDQKKFGKHRLTVLKAYILTIVLPYSFSYFSVLGKFCVPVVSSLHVKVLGKIPYSAWIRNAHSG